MNLVVLGIVSAMFKIHNINAENVSCAYLEYSR